jgi:hypothetical protein
MIPTVISQATIATRLSLRFIQRSPNNVVDESSIAAHESLEVSKRVELQVTQIFPEIMIVASKARILDGGPL